ncbi:MAG: four helix bundle protein [Candidatus Doudnabacteria bacterium]|nr:four helix bundle protein [bacterium]MDZ4243963.1 four helix bundle protein [Candidatus Doudnabacteria bacterium]
MENRGEENKKIISFTDLVAWQEGHKLVLMIYKLTKSFPKEEMFGLTSQMRRAAVSITSNIAEGFSRQYYSEKAQFYSMAQGSNTELQNQLLIAKDVKYLDEKDFSVTAEQSMFVKKLVNGLIKKSKTIRDS